MTGLRSLHDEMPPLLRLAVPIVLGEVGWMAMHFVDIAMIGRVTPEALAAVSLGSAIFAVIAIISEGLLLGNDPPISQAFGAGRHEDCLRQLWAGVQLALPVALVGAAAAALSGRLLAPFGIAPEVCRQAVPFLYALAAGLPALVLFDALRVFLQGTHRVRIIAFAMISANLINFVGNYALIYGHFGLPRLGALGSGLSTTLARAYMALVVLGYVLWSSRREGWRIGQYARKIYTERIRQIVRLGTPAMVQFTIEVGAFSASTLAAGRLGAVAVAGHQIAMTMASMTFMVPLGVAQATSVRVGNAVGRRDLEAARRAGWSGIALSAAFMSCSAVMLWSIPLPIAHIFSHDARVVGIGVPLLLICAVFQFFDGVQVTAIGALRGSGDTRTAMVADLVGWWMFSLPLGAVLCFAMGWGVRGLWIGLSTGLIAIACVMAFAWHRRIERLQRELSTMVAAAESPTAD